ncbi:MAG: hypothetical protein OHK0022_29090 [Roseiflexaceae bacterium]
MRWERLIWLVALVAVGAVGFFGGQTAGIQTGREQRAAAQDQFFGQRGGAGGQGARQGQGGAPGQGGLRAGGALIGTVSAVAGDRITVSTRDGRTVELQIAADGQVRKVVEGKAADIAQGEQITAFGTQSGEVFQASSVQIGGQGGQIAAPLPAGTRP